MIFFRGQTIFQRSVISAAENAVLLLPGGVAFDCYGYGMLSILKNGAVAVGKADVVSPLFRLVNSVDVEGWAEFTYQSLVRARTVYLGYYIDLEKMDEDLEEGWQELLDNGITVSRRQIK